MRGLEKNYLQRIEGKGQNLKKVKGKFRGSAGDEDEMSVNSKGIPKRGRKQAWDKVSRGSSAAGRSVSRK